MQTFEGIEKIIKKTVESTILGLKTAGLLADRNINTFRKTEELLRNYNALSASGDPIAEKMVDNIEKALINIRADPYYEVITLYYIEGWTREQLAERFDTSVTTISRNKKRLVEQLKIILFSCDYIKEIYSDWILM